MLIIASIEPRCFECLFVKVTLYQNKYLTTGSIYRTTSAPAESFFFFSTIDSILFKKEMIILGDFNKKLARSFWNYHRYKLIKEPNRVT